MHLAIRPLFISAQCFHRGLQAFPQLHGVTQFLQGHLHRGDGREDVKLIHISHMGNTEDLSLGLVLAAGNRQVVLFAQDLDYFLAIHSRRGETAVTASEKAFGA